MSVRDTRGEAEGTQRHATLSSGWPSLLPSETYENTCPGPQPIKDPLIDWKGKSEG